MHIQRCAGLQDERELGYGMAKLRHEVRDAIHGFVHFDSLERNRSTVVPFSGCLAFINWPCHTRCIRGRCTVALGNPSV
jgi:hypothetical protein